MNEKNQTTNQSEKSIFQSKTFWANIVALGASGAMAYGIDIAPEEQAYIVTGIMAVVNIVLRFTTKTAIRKK